MAALTIYECPDCGAVALVEPLDEGQEPPVLCSVTHAMPREVRVFREEDVRPLWDALQAVKRELAAGTRDSARYVLRQPPFSDADAFPAPEEWHDRP